MKILPESLTSIFSRVLVEEARHIVFFINWIAWDRTRRGYGAPLVQWLPALLGYAGAIVRRVQGGAAMAGGGEQPGRRQSQPVRRRDAGVDAGEIHPHVITENERYMRDMDPRLVAARDSGGGRVCRWRSSSLLRKFASGWLGRRLRSLNRSSVKGRGFIRGPFFLRT